MARSFGAPAVFRWCAGDAEPPFTWVLLDASYGELQRQDGIDGTELVADPDLRECLESGATYHWFVVGQGAGGPSRSLLETFEIR